MISGRILQSPWLAWASIAHARTCLVFSRPSRKVLQASVQSLAYQLFACGVAGEIVTGFHLIHLKFAGGDGVSVRLRRADQLVKGWVRDTVSAPLIALLDLQLLEAVPPGFLECIERIKGLFPMILVPILQIYSVLLDVFSRVDRTEFCGWGGTVVGCRILGRGLR